MLANYLTSPTCWVLFTGSWIATMVLTPLIIAFARRHGILDHGGYRKINKRSTPLLGGMAIVLPFIGLCLLGIFPPTAMLDKLSPNRSALILLGICSLLAAGLGAVDDIRTLSARKKFLGQFAIAILFCCSRRVLVTSLALPLVGQIDIGNLLGGALTVLWIVGVMNAFNLVDGVDGLASSLALSSAVGLGTIAALSGATFTVILSLGLAGSLGAFLIFNFYPAKIFLGDTGSLFLGFVLAALALLGASRSSGAVMLATPAVVLALPIFDTLTSMGRRMLRGHSPFTGDRRHTHHRLLDLGLSQRQVALLMGGVSLLCTLAGILAQFSGANRHLFTLCIGLAAFVLIILAWANGFLRLRHAMRVAQCHPRNMRLAVFANYASLALNSPPENKGAEDTLSLICEELGLNYLEIALYETNKTICHCEREILPRYAGGKTDPVEILRVEDANQDPLIVRYRLGHYHSIEELNSDDSRDHDQLEHEDIAVCLARLFGKVHAEALYPIASAVSPVAGLSPVTAERKAV